MGNFIVTPSPHITSNHKTSTIMRDVIIALMPALVAAVVVFGIRALVVTAVCVASCVLFEYLIRRVMKRDATISDLSAVVTGILLAYNLPVTIPLWIAVIGSFIAIVVVKQMFGGIGQNFANPALTARIVLFASFAVHMRPGQTRLILIPLLPRPRFWTLNTLIHWRCSLAMCRAAWVKPARWPCY